MEAIGCIKDLTRDKDVLVQIWVPVNQGGRRVLTTHDQPFSLDPSSRRLVNYRDISIQYQFSAEKNSSDVVGLPGRVFLGKIPEWTPDVQLFRSDEYARVRHAQEYDVHGSLAVPVFEQGSTACLGVLEVVTTSQKTKYHPEIESVCKALEAVDLRSSEVPSVQNVMESDKSYQVALPEILKLLKSACDTHRLPLAQTWVSCIQQGKTGCRHSDENYFQCVSIIDHASYVADPNFKAFHEACSEHHLLKGQGVAGQAFLTNEPCFSSDVASFAKTEYPLSHHARMFELRAAAAIRLRSIYTSKTNFVLEFFLPVNCREPEEQRKMLHSLSTIVQWASQSLRVVSDKELQEEIELPVIEEVLRSDDGEKMLNLKHSLSEMFPPENLSRKGSLTEVQQNSTVVSLSQDGKEKGMIEEKPSDRRHGLRDSNLNGSVEYGGDSTFGERSFSSECMDKAEGRKHTKAETTITLQVLRQYFAGSLKDAAKSLGVCPTTLKRIYRQHGINRWPSRKLKKVDQSLKKIQLVIDSVQGASGAFHIGSFYTNFPEFASSKQLETNTLSTEKPIDDPTPSSLMPKGGVFSSQTTATKSPSSSCGQSSCSSHSRSSGTSQHPSASINAGNEEPMAGENSGDAVLKRVRSNAELLASSKKELQQLSRSQSHKSLKEQVAMGSFPLSAKNVDQVLQQMNSQEVKVSYGNEKIRFGMPNNWGLADLLPEITRRFSIDDISRFDLKYFDDDSEWVLLTCDADLEECMDVCQSSQSHPIKLSLQVSHHFLEKSVVNSGPS
ncbi:NIN-like protein 1 [Tripterygium wilfordii]|uniref:NIN-like protein 1 n=1 Tax=Tripterygium wilfordii TaxID=458696 RepID=A0A7J7D3P6_TRIWF|nr:protein NLP4-like [Tripterygium wilfordii]KAF5740952.1 NIN-like protein 1 [Tripterygium wilfordii]